MSWFKQMKWKYSRSSFIRVMQCSFDAFDVQGNRYMIEIPDSFEIYIEYRTKTHTHFGTIDFSEAEKILDFLKENRKSRKLELNISGYGGNSPLIIPRWAISNIISELELQIKIYRNLKEIRYQEKIKSQ